MKSKPLIIGGAILLLLCITFLFVRAKFWSKPEKNEITQFLTAFKTQITRQNTDSVLNYFEVKDKPKPLIKLVNMLIGKTGFDGKSKPLFTLDLENIDSHDVKILGPDIKQIYVPIKFHSEIQADESSVIQFKIHRIAANQYKILQVDARKFLADYLNYENRIKTKTIKPADIYDPLTLAAFKTAEQLKSHYDTVVWFAHEGMKTYYYVAKGKWDIYEAEKGSGEGKMGLIGPDLKEIIPAKFDLIHNINSTLDSLVEVDNGSLHGFYDLTGREVIPAVYDQVFPVDDDIHLAALRKGDDYYWFDKNRQISEKVDIKIKDVLGMLKQNKSFTYTSYYPGLLTEFNSKEEHTAIYISPSYLLDLSLMAKFQKYPNGMRRNVNYEDVSKSYEVNYTNTAATKEGNWLEAAFYSIRDYFIGGRSEFYDSKKVVITDAKTNRVYATDFQIDYGMDEGGEALSGKCNENEIRMINDTLYEIKSTALAAVYIDEKRDLSEGPAYHYMYIKNNKLVEKHTNRFFGFTKFVKMDDSYLDGCFVYNSKVKNRLPNTLLSYMKNEIYADYGYEFKDTTWASVFENRFESKNKSVEDSLTETDRYNINWINQKLKENPTKVLAAK